MIINNNYKYNRFVPGIVTNADDLRTTRYLFVSNVNEHFCCNRTTQGVPRGDIHGPTPGVPQGDIHGPTPGVPQGNILYLISHTDRSVNVTVSRLPPDAGVLPFVVHLRGGETRRVDVPPRRFICLENSTTTSGMNVVYIIITSWLSRQRVYIYNLAL